MISILGRRILPPAAGVLAVAAVFGSVPARGDDPDAAPLPRGYAIPIVDLDGDADRQVVVDREPGQYLGHPTTLLLEDGRTVLCVYPKGHGRGPIVYKRSDDGGRTWSERLPTPASWETSKETPTLHRVVGPDGTRRVILFSGLYPVRSSLSEDDGRAWTELEPIGPPGRPFGGIVAMGAVVAIPGSPGSHLAFFHDDGRYFRGTGVQTKPPTFTLYQTRSDDGGLTWSEPRAIQSDSAIHLCEPGAIRSPDGRRLVLLLRENRRLRNSHAMYSDDDGETWSEPRPLHPALTGDRHVAVRAPDGRLFISFRDTTLESPTKGDWVAWVGTYDDILAGRPGQYRVRLKKNHRAIDCAYPGVESLPDGTILTTTYGHWTPGEAPYILAVRLKLEELDARLEANRAGVPPLVP